MVEIIKNSGEVSKKGSKIPFEKVLEGSDNLKELMRIKPLSEKKEFSAKFYINEPLSIHSGNIEINIENPMVYAGHRRDLPVAIDVDVPISINGYKNSSFLSADYFNFTEKERYLYLQWLASNRTIDITDSKILVLFFRNIQHRSVTENLDRKPILFELLRIYEKYRGSHYYFNTNFLELIVYLVFNTDDEFSEEENDSLLTFVEKYREEVEIEESYFALVYKLKNIDVENLAEELFGIDYSDIDKTVESVYNFIKTRDDLLNSQKVNKSIFSRSFKKTPLMLTVLKILAHQSPETFSRENLKIEIRNVEHKYNNYYLASRANTNYVIKTFNLKPNEELLAILQAAIGIVEDYEDKRNETAKKNGKSLSDSEKYDLLPPFVQKYFDAIGSKRKKPKKEEKKFEKVELSLDRDKICFIREDTNEIQCVLKSVFNEEDENIKQIVEVIEEGGLPKKYTNFMNYIMEKSSWSRKELMEYCSENGLMLSEAIDRVNEYYDEKYGDYLIEDEGNIILVNK